MWGRHTSTHTNAYIHEPTVTGGQLDPVAQEKKRLEMEKFRRDEAAKQQAALQKKQDSLKMEVTPIARACLRIFILPQGCSLV